MNLGIWIRINQDPRQRQFLRENSHWYKYLNRSDTYYKQFIDDMKIKYKLTTSDKLNKMIDNINLVRSFLDVLK